MGKEILMFDNIEIEKNKFYRYKTFLIKDYGLSEKYNTIWDKVSVISEKNLIASLFIIKII